MAVTHGLMPVTTLVLPTSDIIVGWSPPQATLRSANDCLTPTASTEAKYQDPPATSQTIHAFLSPDTPFAQKRKNKKPDKQTALKLFISFLFSRERQI